MNKKLYVYGAIVLVGLLLFVGFSFMPIIDNNVASTDNAGEIETVVLQANDANNVKGDILETKPEVKSKIEPVLTKSDISQIDNVIKDYYNINQTVDSSFLFNEDNSKNIVDMKELVDKREGIEAYENIQIITKPGLEPNSFIVFTTYTMKFYHIDTLAPGMSVLHLVRSEGKYFIDYELSEELTKHIETLTKEANIQSLVKKINADLKKAIDKDKELKELIERLNRKK